MLVYVTVGSRDLAKSQAFYDPVLAVLGYVRLVSVPDEIGYGPPDPAPGTRKCRFYALLPFNKEPATFGNGVTVALDAPSRAAVDAFHAAGLAAGGTNEGAPGLRLAFHPNFYSAYVRDPDGNKISAMFERPVSG